MELSEMKDYPDQTFVFYNLLKLPRSRSDSQLYHFPTHLMINQSFHSNSMRLSKKKPTKYSTSILRRSRRIKCFILRSNCKIPLSNTINISVINVHSRKPCINILSLFFFFLIMHYILLTWIKLFEYHLWSSHLLFPNQWNTRNIKFHINFLPKLKYPITTKTTTKQLGVRVSFGYRFFRPLSLLIKWC